MKFLKQVTLFVTLSLLLLTGCSSTGDETVEKESDTTVDTVSNPTVKSSLPKFKPDTYPKSEDKDYSGTYLGYSWKGEQSGVTFDEATQFVETILTLDADGTILDTVINFTKVRDDGTTYDRNDTASTVSVDFSTKIKPATLGDDGSYTIGTSMFDIDTNDMMSFYSVAVDKDGTIAFGITDPLTRYFFESKIDSSFDLDKPFTELELIPTVRTSSSGLIKPSSWDELDGKTILDFHDYSYVITREGPFTGATNDTTIKEFLTMAGVSFTNNTPIEQSPTYGFHSIGGWAGNYENIAKVLNGLDAREILSLANFDTYGYDNDTILLSKSINDDNFFGYNRDTVTGATRTIQNSYDTISGATVRVSRENTSFQRALVDAGLLTESDVIKGRF